MSERVSDLSEYFIITCVLDMSKPTFEYLTPSTANEYWSVYVLMYSDWQIVEMLVKYPTEE